MAAFARKEGLRHRILLMGGDVARSRYRVRGVPANFLIDREGRIIHQSVGFSPGHAGEFETRIANALAGS